uniref:Uncharacterized protein n=1 Tax=Anopheles arabiensis TaxID=7173 RepID=A0A182I5Z6_ANOAR
MVNKQYNVHNPKLHKSKLPGGSGSGSSGHSSPSPLRSSYPVISTRPAGASDEDGFSVESDSNNLSDHQSASSGGGASGYGVGHPRQLPPPPPPPTHRHRGTQSTQPHHHQQQQPQQPQNNLNISRRSASAEPVHGQEEVNGDDGLYGRNIQFYSEGRGIGETDVVGESGHTGRFGHGHGGKELTISDIGRFQYILQMDREVHRQDDKPIIPISETEQEISFVTFTSKNITLEALRTSL